MPPSLGLVVLSHVTVGVRGLGVPLSLPLSAPGMRARSLSLSLSLALSFSPISLFLNLLLSPRAYLTRVFYLQRVTL